MGRIRSRRKAVPGQAHRGTEARRAVAEPLLCSSTLRQGSPLLAGVCRAGIGPPPVLRFGDAPASFFRQPALPSRNARARKHPQLIPYRFQAPDFRFHRPNHFAARHSRETRGKLLLDSRDSGKNSRSRQHPQCYDCALALAATNGRPGREPRSPHRKTPATGYGSAHLPGLRAKTCLRGLGPRRV